MLRNKIDVRAKLIQPTAAGAAAAKMRLLSAMRLKLGECKATWDRTGCAHSAQLVDMLTAKGFSARHFGSNLLDETGNGCCDHRAIEGSILIYLKPACPARPVRLHQRLHNAVHTNICSQM